MYSTGQNRDPLLTRDVDFAIPRHNFIDSIPSLDKTIIAAGFKYEFASLDNPPVIHYAKALENSTVAEIEFITDAQGQQEDIVEIGSINAQGLRYVGLLLENPLEVNLTDLGCNKEMVIRVPRPSAYILHKTLIANRRRQRQKTAKDLYCVFYTLESFPEWQESIFQELQAYKDTHSKLVARALEYLSTRFDNIDSSGVDYLLSQRPTTTFPEMSDDQFRQYALATMNSLIIKMC